MRVEQDLAAALRRRDLEGLFRFCHWEFMGGDDVPHPLHLLVTRRADDAGPVDPIVAHSDPWGSFCLYTKRTARSRTSGEYLFVSFITPYPQTKESPVNPGQFTC